MQLSPADKRVAAVTAIGLIAMIGGAIALTLGVVLGAVFAAVGFGLAMTGPIYVFWIR